MRVELKPVSGKGMYAKLRPLICLGLNVTRVNLLHAGPRDRVAGPESTVDAHLLLPGSAPMLCNLAPPTSLSSHFILLLVLKMAIFRV